VGRVEIHDPAAGRRFYTFFWSHSTLWFYREWRDRKRGVHHILIDSAGHPVVVPDPVADRGGKYVR
jgi:hypothetical protein